MRVWPCRSSRTGEPTQVSVCHCDFGQRRSGNVFIASVAFPGDQIMAITGETWRYNGLEVDGVGAVATPGGINYHFCAVCGSSISLRHDLSAVPASASSRSCRQLRRRSVPASNDRVFHESRYLWVPPIADAVQIYDPMGVDAELALRASNRRVA